MPQFAYFCGHEQFQPEVLLEHAVLAESVGFDALTVSDHFHPWVDDASACGFAWTWLGALAARTRRVRIATAVTCPLFHYHPGLIAQAAATVDRLSGGRFALGVGHRRGHQRAAARLSVPGLQGARGPDDRGDRHHAGAAGRREARLRRHLLPHRQGPALQPAASAGCPIWMSAGGPQSATPRRPDRRRAHPERQGSRRGPRADHRPVPRGRAGGRPPRADAGGPALVDPGRGRGRGLGRRSRPGAGSGSRGAWRRSIPPCSGPAPTPWTAGRSSESTRGRAGRRISSRSTGRSSRSARTSSRSR